MIQGLERFQSLHQPVYFNRFENAIVKLSRKISSTNSTIQNAIFCIFFTISCGNIFLFCIILSVFLEKTGVLSDPGGKYN